MKKPVIASKKSIKLEVVNGQSYFWCSCGLSANQPFCDGSHQNTEFSPIEYIADKDGIASFCGCKYSKKGALCDGTHKEQFIIEA